MSILKQLWLGTFNPECPPLSPEYSERQDAYSKHADEFLNTLTKEQRKMVLKLEAEQNAIRELEEELLFENSFRYGARLILELLRP